MREAEAYLFVPDGIDYSLSATVKVVRDRREKVIVFDYWADK